jgi:hypothetical protein
VVQPKGTSVLYEHTLAPWTSKRIGAVTAFHRVDACFERLQWGLFPRPVMAGTLTLHANVVDSAAQVGTEDAAQRVGCRATLRLSESERCQRRLGRRVDGGPVAGLDPVPTENSIRAGVRGGIR